MGFLKFLFGDNNSGEREEILSEEFEIKSTYGWSEFFPDYCEGKYVNAIIKNDSKIVIDGEIKDDDVAYALSEIEKPAFQEKVFNDLCEAGFAVSDSFIVALGRVIEDGPFYRQVVDMLTPPYQVETIFSILYNEAENAETSDFEHYLKNRKGKLSVDQVLEIDENFPNMSKDVIEEILSDVRDSLTFKQVRTILQNMEDISSHSKELLLMDIKGEPQYGVIDDIFSLIDRNMYGLMSVYVAKLKKKEQDELHEDYEF